MKLLALNLTDPNVNPTAKLSNVGTIFSLLLKIALSVGAIIFLFYAMYGAYLIITAGSEADKIQKAKRTFTYSIAGIILMFLSVVLAKIVGFVFRLNFKF